MYEYWGNYDIDGDGIAEAIVCAWVGDTIIRLETNPYPDGKPPFLVVPFNPTPFKAHGEASAELIGDNQKVKTAVLRGIMDNMAQSTNGQVGIREGALDQTNKARYCRVVTLSSTELHRTVGKVVTTQFPVVRLTYLD